MMPIRVAFVFNVDSSFVRRDRAILERYFRVRDVPWRGKRSLPRLVWSVLRSDVTFSWFALDHAYGACRLAKLFGRSSIVVVAGVDAAKRPDLVYGVHLDPKMGPRSRYALQNTDRVLTVDEFLRDEIRRNTGIDRREIITVPFGFDTDRYRPDDRAKKNVLTVGIVEEVNVRRKGLLTFVQAAAHLPDLPFVLVGGQDNDATKRLENVASSNVQIVPRLNEDELLEQFQRAKVYVQASEYEGLPAALGEAMASGCIPVGTRVAGIPTLIGETGFYVPAQDPVATADAIRRAYDYGDSVAARNRIVAYFTIERREKALRDVIDQLVTSGDGASTQLG